MPLWLHVAACVVVPGVWGVLMYFAFSAFDRRRGESTQEGPPPIDYSI